MTPESNQVEYVTKQDLQIAITEVKLEIVKLRGEIMPEFQKFRVDMYKAEVVMTMVLIGIMAALKLF